MSWFTVHEDPEPGAIRDSNRTLLQGLLHELGADVRDYGIVGDTPGSFEAALDDATSGADVVVTSGGVSMGAYDVVKLSLRERGTVDFWKIAMQPGKPFGFGTVEGVPFFGLPGNPVSVFVSFEQFMRPALLTMMGADASLQRPGHRCPRCRDRHESGQGRLRPSQHRTRLERRVAREAFGGSIVERTLGAGLR